MLYPTVSDKIVFHCSVRKIMGVVVKDAVEMAAVGLAEVAAVGLTEVALWA